MEEGFVEITGEYGIPNGEIRIRDSRGREIVMWSEDEWIEDSTLVYLIAQVVEEVARDGVSDIKKRINWREHYHEKAKLGLRFAEINKIRKELWRNYP
jgi:hypothetical protein